ncbi:MAG: hypothetical protein ABI432_16280 [Flavobacteriales bacterium]
MIGTLQDRTLTPAVKALINELMHHFERRRLDLIVQRDLRRSSLSQGNVDLLPDTAHVRTSEWKVDPVPDALNERRVELIGGTSRSELINGLNAGAKSYIADLWNFSPGDSWSMVRSHRSLARIARLDLAFLEPTEGRIRVNPATSTRLMVVPRPIHALEGAITVNGEPVPASFFDVVMLALNCGEALSERQGGLYLVLRDVHGHLEARLWSQLFNAVEEHTGLTRGTIRATVMIDSIAAALEADEILFELMHHAAGLSFDPQGYAADHIALFNGPDRPVMPDREVIGLNSPFLRALSLLTVGTAHRRGCHAIGAPTFVLPPHDPNRLKATYLEMLADKEREAVDGYDGTIVVHADTVNAAMVEFNKSMPRANQLYYQRTDHIPPSELVKRPEGPITVDSLVGTIRTALRSLVQRELGKGWVIQGGRMHDRSSLRLSIRLLWHWNKSRHGVITATGMDIGYDLLHYLVRKEADKMFSGEDDRTRKLGAQAVERLLEIVQGDHIPLEPIP